MKRILSLLLITVILTASTSAYAKLTVTGPNSERAAEWLEEMQSDNLVEKILIGNIAFVDNCKRAWDGKKIITMDVPARYDSETQQFYIPAKAAKTFFGTSAASGEVSSNKIKEETGKHCFIDPRGFCLFSDTDVVNTSVPTGYSSYRDYSTVANAISYIAWEDVEFTAEERMAYIDRWKQALTYPEGEELEWAGFIKTQIEAAIKAEKNVKVSETGEYSFEGITLDGFDLEGADLTQFKKNLLECYRALKTMSIGYTCYLGAKDIDGAISASLKKQAEEADLKTKILGGLDYLLQYYSKSWSPVMDSKYSWVTTQFSIPYMCSDTLCLMYDFMTDEQRIAYTNQLFDKSPVPDVRTTNKQPGQETYTNRLWRCLSFFHIAVLANDSYRMNYAIKYCAPAFMYAARNDGFDQVQFGKDGFYKDGSMIFHNKTPYNLGYGMSYAVLIYEFQELTKGTKFDLQKIHGFENVYDFCLNNLLPFVVNGQLMRMAQGRDVSTSEDLSILRPCAFIAVNAPEPKRSEMISRLKGLLNGREISTGTMQYELNLPALTKFCTDFKKYAAQLDADAQSANSSTVYYNQDEAVHRRDKFTATLQMSSSRVAKYECIPPTNDTGWYLGDGMLYVYTDNKQYGKNYFNTVNPYYMPGTTVDSTPRRSINTDTETSRGNWGLPDNDWAGGVTDGENVAAGFIMGNKFVSGLQGRKSYFMIGDKIVCIGTGITGGEGDVYTVVENRIIDKESENIKPVSVGHIPAKITCSNPDKNEAAQLSVDGSVNTSLTMPAVGDYVTYDFGQEVNIGKLGLAFYYGNQRQTYVTVQVSEDGEAFKTLKEYTTSGTTSDVELYDMNCTTRYVRLISGGNSKNAWFNLAEAVFYKDTVTPEEIEKSKVLITTGFEKLVIDGKEDDVVFNETHSVENPGWVWVEGQSGFVFHKNSRLDIMRERQPSSPVYMRMSIDHGSKPNASEYAYTQLPKATLEEVAAYSENPDIEILASSNDLHAVLDTGSGTIYANIYKKGAELGGIRFDTPCAVIIKASASKIYISDPTWKSDKLSFVLPDTAGAPTGLNVSTKGKEVIIDVSPARGKTYVVNCRLSDNSDNKGSIDVLNYELEYADGHFISTWLYGSSVNGEVKFEVVTPPKSGRAFIFGNILYYVPSNMFSTDKLTIRASDEAGNTSDFNVTVNSKRGER